MVTDLTRDQKAFRLEFEFVFGILDVNASFDVLIVLVHELRAST